MTIAPTWLPRYARDIISLFNRPKGCVNPDQRPHAGFPKPFGGVKEANLITSKDHIQRWPKKWTCFTKLQPGKARQKFLAT